MLPIARKERAGAARVDRFPLRPQYDIVDLALPVVEPPVDRQRARDVASLQGDSSDMRRHFEARFASTYPSHRLVEGLHQI